MNLAEKLNILMKKSNIKNPKELSQNMQQLGLCIPYTTLLTIINDEVQDIKLGTAKKLCSFFNVTLDELLDNNISINAINYININIDGLDTDDIKKIYEYIDILKLAKKAKSDIKGE